MLTSYPIPSIRHVIILVVTVILLAGAPAPAHLVSTGSLGPLNLGPGDTVSFNTDTGQYSINGGPPIPGGIHDANGAMVFNFTVIELHNTTAVTAYGSNPLALAAIGPVNVAGPINLRGCTPATCGSLVIAGGGRNGAGGNVSGQGGNGGTGGRNGQNLPGGQGGIGSGPGSGTCPNANGGGGGGGGGGYTQVAKGTGGNGAVTGGGGGGEGGATGNPGGNAVGNNPGSGGSGGSVTGGDGGNGNNNGGAAMPGFNGTPNQAGGGGGGGGGGAVAAGNGGDGGNGGFGGGAGGGGGGTKCGASAGKGGSGGGGAAIVSSFAGVGPYLGGGGGGGSGGKSHFSTSYAPSGGGGGGAIAIDSLTAISFMSGGLIDVRGADASSMGGTGDGAGGGGGGGAICLSAPVVSGTVPGSNLLIAGGVSSLGQPAGSGVVVIQPIVACDPNDAVTATSSCSCAEPGHTITFTLHNNSAASIYLSNSAPFEIRTSAGQVVYRPPCVLHQVVTIPAGQSQSFTWDQRDWGNQTLSGCEWNNAAQVANGTYTFAVGFSTDAQCASQSVRCTSLQIGNCVTVTTDKDCYAPGEHVTVTVTNNSCGVINLLNSSPWQIRDAANNLVYQPACVFWIVIPLNSGESHTFTLGGGTDDGTTWDQLDDGNGLVGCGYQNRAQVANGTYKACVAYSAEGGQGTACTTFKIANNCVAVDPDCFCNMPGGPARIVILNSSTEPIMLPNLQPWRIKNMVGQVTYEPTHSGSPFTLVPGQSYPVYWDQTDSYGQLAPSGPYIAEFDWIELPGTPHIAHGGLQLGGCLRLTLDQDCYLPGEVVTAKAVNTACQQIYLTLCDVGPILVKDDQGDTVWTYPCDTACDATRIMQSGEVRTWTWNQKDEGDGTHSNCEGWNNANQVANGHYCAQVPYADVNFLRHFTAQKCLDIGADCADLTADKDCYETGDQTCFTLSNNTGGAITVDRPWRILDGNGNEVHPGAGCFIFWIPIVIADGSCHQFCWDQQVCFTPPLVAPGNYTFEVHFTEVDGTEHTYFQDFQILAAGGCTPPPPDCNHNGTPDSEDIARGISLDCDANGVPDECEYPGCTGLLTGDMNCDGKVDGRDISGFLKYLLGGLYTCQADVNQDGAVDMLDVQPLIDLLLCWPNCPLAGPSVRSDRLCYFSGETVVVYVDMPPTATGSLVFSVYQEADDGGGTLVHEETRPLDGLSTYSFSIVPPEMGMFDTVGRWLDPGEQEKGADGLRIGVHPNLPQIPVEVCTFETFTLDASVLRSQVEAAVAEQSPMVLSIGSRSFEVLLQSSSGIVDPNEFTKEPTLALFRGRITCNPNSEVRLTFVHGLASAMVDQGLDQWGVYLEPAYQHDPGLPFNLYLGYRSDHVRIPMRPHGPLTSGRADDLLSPLSPEGLVSASADGVDVLSGPRSEGRAAGTRCLRFNVYYDNDPSGVRYTNWNNIAGTFLVRFPTLSYVTAGFTQINTNAYNDPTDAYCNPPGLFKSFRDAVGAVPAGYDIDVLFTANSTNISYGDYLGQSGWRRNAYAGTSWTCGGDERSAHCWVRSDGSNYRTRIVGCHEISHTLGASDTTSAHRDGVMRTQCDVWGPLHIICYWSHNVYSIMCSAYYGDSSADANWFDSDKTTIRNTINNTAGHFCNP